MSGHWAGKGRGLRQEVGWREGEAKSHWWGRGLMCGPHPEVVERLGHRRTGGGVGSLCRLTGCPH